MIGNRARLSSRMKALLALTPICFLGAMVAAPVEARENYALIAAASDYPNLDAKYWLKGPKNDAVLVRDYLLNAAPVKFLPENVATLGSGEGLELATHDAILGQLAAIAAKAKKGDFVFLQFSGHGSYQPATAADTTEADGRDEIFLAADTKMADGGANMPNVITDNELSPVAGLGDPVLFVKEARLGHFRSQVPALVLCQSIIVSVGRRLGQP